MVENFKTFLKYSPGIRLWQVRTTNERPLIYTKTAGFPGCFLLPREIPFLYYLGLLAGRQQMQE
jgi:hypothetical protein